MPDHPKPEKKNLPSSKDFQIPPIPKQTAGAVTGAAIGSIVGPTGAVVGGVVGALVGKAASDRRPVGKAVRRATGVRKAHSNDTL
jgi:Glycine zipper